MKLCVTKWKKICSKSVCTNSSLVRNFAPFGEDAVTPSNSAMTFTNSSLGCQDAIKWLILNNQSVTYYCKTTIKSNCQISCLPFLKLACTDDYFDCPKLGQSYCGGSLGSQPFKSVRTNSRIFSLTNFNTKCVIVLLLLLFLLLMCKDLQTYLLQLSRYDFTFDDVSTKSFDLIHRLCLFTTNQPISSSASHSWPAQMRQLHILVPERRNMCQRNKLCNRHYS